MFNRPRRLIPGSTVRIVSPSLPSMAFADVRADRARTALEKIGLRVEFSRNCYEISDDGISAGDAQVRADDINEAFADQSVDGVIAAVGGETTREVLPFLDADLLKANPKVFLGRSDNVYLNAFLFETAEMISFYGVTFLGQLGEYPAPMPETIGSFVSVLMQDDTVYYRTPERLSVPSTNWSIPAGKDHSPAELTWAGKTMWLNEGYAVGRLVGGELSLVTDMLRRDLISLRGRILFWDISSAIQGYAQENFAMVSEMADLTELGGMIIADNPSVPFEEWSEFVWSMLERTVGRIQYPVLIGADCGHYDPTWVVPYGDFLTLDSAAGLTYRIADSAAKRVRR